MLNLTRAIDRATSATVFVPPADDDAPGTQLRASERACAPVERDGPAAAPACAGDVRDVQERWVRCARGVGCV